MMKTYSLLLILLGVLFCSCSKKESKQARWEHGEPPIPDVVCTSDIKLPGSVDSIDISQKSTKVITADGAVNYLGESAKHYRWYNFVCMATGKYTIGNDSVSVEIAQFATVEDAYGFYASMRPSGVELNQLGGESYTSGNSIYFFLDEYVVTLSVPGEVTSSFETILPLANEIVTLVDMPPRIPGYYMLFPSRGRIYPSNRYYPYNFLDIAGLDSVFTNDYFVNEDSVSLFLTLDTSGTKFIKLRDYAEENYHVVFNPRPFPFEKDLSFAFEHPQRGVIVAGLVRNTLVGIIDYNPKTAESLFAEWVKGLK